MRPPRRNLRLLVLLAALVLPAPAARADEARELVGLWAARRHFGPEVRGELTLEQSGDAWAARVAGRTAPVRRKGDEWSFELADGKGSFRGRLVDGRVVGHWVQPPTVSGGAAYATPVSLGPRGRGRWGGVVTPLDDDMTFYLPVRLQGDGTLSAFLRNPERNAGRFLSVERVVREGRTVKLLGRPSGRGPEVEVASGTYDSGTGRLSITLPSSGGTFEFRRADAEDEAGFYSRGKAPAPWAYRPPPAGEDGWPVAALDDVGISRDGVAHFVRMLTEMPMDSVHASDVHAVLIARHGKLVLEEYFHGFGRDRLHDTRSAAKSLTSLLTGAAILHGDRVALSTPVYETMDGRAALAGLDPRKRALTVEHLLTMSSGLDCDDAAPASRGNEDTMQDQTAQPDWYRYTLDLPAVRRPGEKAVYGSANPHLLGGVLARATSRRLPGLFRERLAEPLQVRRYAMNLTPTGEAYMGGGVRLAARDFLKLAQVVLDGGRWRGRPVVGGEWARRSTSPLYELRGLHYGYLWWVADYPWKGRTVRAFFAGGNGGQIALGVPELDLAIAFFGGNYSDPVALVPQRAWVPRYILPAVDGSADR
jgi:CubicO group peptidase (beta-lactamase class C family)